MGPKGQAERFKFQHCHRLAAFERIKYLIVFDKSLYQFISTTDLSDKKKFMLSPAPEQAAEKKSINLLFRPPPPRSSSWNLILFKAFSDAIKRSAAPLIGQLCRRFNFSSRQSFSFAVICNVFAYCRAYSFGGFCCCLLLSKLSERWIKGRKYPSEGRGNPIFLAALFSPFSMYCIH